MNGTEPVLLILRRIEQAIYGLEHVIRNLNLQEIADLSSPSQPQMEFRDFVRVEVESGNLDVRIEDQPIQAIVEDLSDFQTDPIEIPSSNTDSDIVLIQGSSDSRIIVYGFFLSNRADTSVSVQFRDDASPDPTVLTGRMMIEAGNSIQYSGFYRVFELDLGRSLVLNRDPLGALGGFIVYRMVSSL